VCSVLELGYTPDEHKETIMKWCHKLYEISFLEPLKEMCSEPIPKQDDYLLIGSHHFRTKRELATLTIILLVGGALLGATAIGNVVAAALGFSNTAALQAEVNKLKDDNEELKAYIEKVSSELTELTRRYEIQKAKDAAIHQTLFDLLPTVTSLSSSFLEIRLKLQKTLYLKQKGKFNVDLLRIFNLTLPCHPKCSSDIIAFTKCHFIPERNAATFHLVVPEIVEELVLLKSETFVLATERPSRICLTEYSGPSKVIYNQTSHKFCLVDDVIQPDIIGNIMRKPIGCSYLANKPDLSPYWRETKCFSTDQFQKEKVIQIKSNANQISVYCRWNNITLFNVTSICPSFVISFTDKATFKINQVEFEAKQNKIWASHLTMPDWILNINRNLMANTPHHEIENLTSKFIPENNANLKFSYLAVIITTISLSLTIVVFSIAAYIYVTRIRRERDYTKIRYRRQPPPPSIDLEQTSHQEE